MYYLGNVAVVEGGTDRGDSYTVWSHAPQPTPQELARSRPRYHATTWPGSTSRSTGIEMPAVRIARSRARRCRTSSTAIRGSAQYAGVYQQARDLVGNPRNPYAAVVALETWFRGGGDFVYDEQPPRGRGGTPPLVSFVTATRRGYCQHFAGAMALMLRQLGIPARVAAGFTSGRYDRDEEHWVVADRNAHTWVEAWFEGFGLAAVRPHAGPRGARGHVHLVVGSLRRRRRPAGDRRRQ